MPYKSKCSVCGRLREEPVKNALLSLAEVGMTETGYSRPPMLSPSKRWFIQRIN